MENKKSMWSYAFQYGAIMGLASVILSVALYFIFPFDPETLKPKGGAGWIQTVLSLLLIFGILFWATKTYRDEALDGLMSYGKSVGFAIAIALPFLIISAIYTFVFFKFIDPELISKIAEKQYEAMAAKGMSDEQMEQSASVMNIMNNPAMYSLFGGLGAFFQVLIVSLISSIFTKREPNSSAE